MIQTIHTNSHLRTSIHAHVLPKQTQMHTNLYKHNDSVRTRGNHHMSMNIKQEKYYVYLKERMSDDVSFIGPRSQAGMGVAVEERL